MYARQVPRYSRRVPRAKTPATGARRRNPRGEGDRLRTALMDAASELLIELGSADKLSIRGVTAHAGVTPTALYLHFADKEDLLNAVVARSFQELRAFLLDAEARHEGDPPAQFAAMGRAYIAFALERPAHYRIIFGTHVPGGKPVPVDLEPEEDDPGLQAFHDLVRAVARCISDERDPFEIAVLIWTALHGFVTLQAVMPNFPWPAAERYLDELHAAYLTPGGRGGRAGR